jgi:hypothetical protein
VKTNKEKFFYPCSTYRGEFTPERLAFNSNLQEFAQRVSLICGLETVAKLRQMKFILKLKSFGKA